MCTEMKTALGAFIALLVLLTAVPVSAQSDRGLSQAGFNPAGTWIESSVDVGEPPFLVTIVPLGQGRTNYAFVCEILRDFGFGSSEYTAYRGVATRVAHNTFDFTMLCYATDETDTVVVLNVASGTSTFTDCDNFVATASVALYSPDQDPLGADPPLYGCVPISHTFTRVPVVPPCEP